MKEKVTRRAYTASVDSACPEFPNVHELVEKTYQFMNKGFKFFRSEFLTILGGYSPKLKCCTEEFCFENLLGKPRSIKKWGSCFLHWFSLEKTIGAPKNFIVPTEQVLAKFLSYLADFGITDYKDDPYWAVFQHAITDKAKYSDNVWVDRRAAFLEWNKAQGLDVNQFAHFFFESVDYPMAPDKDTGAIFFRGFFSSLFGDGKKTDSAGVINTYNKALELLRPNIRRKDFLTQIKPHVVIKPGRPTAFMVYLKKCEEEGNTIISAFEVDLVREKIKNGIADETAALKKWQAKGEWVGRLQKRWESFLGLLYKGNSTVFVHMADIGLRNIRAMKSNFVNQLNNRASYYAKLAELPADLDEDLAKMFKKWKENNEQEFITQRQINRIGCLFDAWVESADLVKTAKEFVEERQQGDVNFYAELGRILENKFDRSDPYYYLKQIENYVEKEYLTEKLTYTKNPPVAHIDGVKVTESPQFSADDNLPYGTFDFASRKPGKVKKFGKGHYTRWLVEFDLYNGKEFVPTKIPIYCERFTQECLEHFEPTNDKMVPPRNDKLQQMQNNNQPLKLKGNRTITFSLIKKKGVWRTSRLQRYGLIMSIKLPVAPLKYQGVEKDVRVMGVDLGVRSAASYSIFEMDSNRLETDKDYWNVAEHILRVKNKKNNTAVNIKLIQEGFVETRETIHRGAERGLVLNSLEERMVPLTPEDKQFWQLVFGDNNYPSTLADFTFKLSRHALSLCLDKSMSVFYAQTMFTKVFREILSGRTGTGLLSYTRINVLKNLRRAVLSLIARLENLGQTNDELLEYADNLLVKTNGLRLDRARKTANAILRTALENNVKVIMIEDLNIQGSYTARRSMNRMIDSWCPKKVGEILKMQAELHGIKIVEIDPRHTSRADFVDSVVRSRFDKVKVSEIKNSTGRFARYMKDNLKKPKYSSQQSVHQDMVALAEQIKGLKPSDEVYFPSTWGALYKSKFKGTYISSDIHASYNIVKRGIAYLLGSLPKKKSAAVA